MSKNKQTIPAMEPDSNGGNPATDANHKAHNGDKQFDQNRVGNQKDKEPSTSRTKELASLDYNMWFLADFVWAIISVHNYLAELIGIEGGPEEIEIHQHEGSPIFDDLYTLIHFYREPEGNYFEIRESFLAMKELMAKIPLAHFPDELTEILKGVEEWLKNEPIGIGKVAVLSLGQNTPENREKIYQTIIANKLKVSIDPDAVDPQDQVRISLGVLEELKEQMN